MISLAGRITLYALLATYGLCLVGLWGWQLQVFRGRSMENPDGSVDDWQKEPLCYGIAFADLVFSCPMGLAAIAIILVGWRFGQCSRTPSRMAMRYSYLV